MKGQVGNSNFGPNVVYCVCMRHCVIVQGPKGQGSKGLGIKGQDQRARGQQTKGLINSVTVKSILQSTLVPNWWHRLWPSTLQTFDILHLIFANSKTHQQIDPFETYKISKSRPPRAPKATLFVDVGIKDSINFRISRPPQTNISSI